MINRKILLFLFLVQLTICSTLKDEGQNIHKHKDFLKSPTDGDLKYVITSSRLDELRKDLMYWYSDEDYQDVIRESSPTVQKDLDFQLPFFGFRFNYTRVSLNGYLEFSDPPEYRHYPLIFPNKNWPKENDHSFIGIFFSKCRIGKLKIEDGGQKSPGVYFRVERDLQNREDEFGVELRERLTWDVRQSIVGAATFTPKHAIITTWKNISFSGGISNALFTTNTFQMVLATDEVFTYAIFNYLDLQWTTHTEAGGDTSTGEGGVPAYVGFNAGNGTRSYEYNPYSQSSIIRNLTKTGWGNNFPGRHVFRIDENITPGSCNIDLDGANFPLVISPESGNMLGGTIVNITGPCFEPNDEIRCKFDIADDVPGIYITRNRAMCIQPQLFVEGYVKMEISINQSQYKWKANYFVETPATSNKEITFERSVHEKNPIVIKTNWEKQNLTKNELAKVKMSLWGYREQTIKPEFVYIDILDDNIKNDGEFIIRPENYNRRNNKHLTDIKFGFVQLNVSNVLKTGDIEVVPVMWSRPIPLGWYFGSQWEKEHGENWSQDLCDEWALKDRLLKNFTNNLPECPCNLKDALNDKGRFLPDINCDKDSNPDCQYHPSAIHCVRSGVPKWGSEQQCCYDINGYLILTSKLPWGGSPFRSHNLGNLPFDEAFKVPTLSQWCNDMVPKYLCCLWQDRNSDGCEMLRFERRPSQDCAGYQPPSVAGVFEDNSTKYPQITNYDNLKYVFRGVGEFTLVQVRNENLRFDVQGRFEEFPKDEDERKSKLSAIAVRENSSTTIEVKLRPKYADWRYKLDVFADGKRIYFDRPTHKFQHFSGVLVYTPTNILNQSEVIIMFDSGIGVEVLENNGLLISKTYVPKEFTNQIHGLFGNMNSDNYVDFMGRNGYPTSVVDMDMQIRYHQEFAEKWMVNDKNKNNEKLFNHCSIAEV